MKDRVEFQLGLSHLLFMTIVIASSIQNTPPVDGFVQRPYVGFELLTSGSATAGTIAGTVSTLEIRANTTYINSRSETAVRLAAPLRPNGMAALHVVGQDFIDITMSTMSKATIRRFF